MKENHESSQAERSPTVGRVQHLGENGAVHEATNRRQPVQTNLIRRKLTGASLGVPVLMTMVSKPALGAQCLSNMMSGNLSDPNRGNCSKGWSPGGWGQPGGMIGSRSTLQAWVDAGYLYGTLKLDANPSKFDSYTGGTKLSTTPIIPPPGAPADVTMRETLTTPYSGTLAFHLVAAFLNAKLSESSTTDNFQYILTSAQVLALASNGQLPPGYTDLKAFLNSTWQ